MSTSREFRDLQKRFNSAVDRMSALNEQAAAAGRLFTGEEQEAWARDEAEASGIQRQLDLMRGTLQQEGDRARPMENPMQHLAMPERSAGKPFKAQAFTRFVAALALSKGNLMQAAEIAKRWDHETPEVSNVLQAAVRLGSSSDEFWVQRAATQPGTTVSPTWAAPLVNYQSMSNEFIDLLRPATIVGRLKYQSIPFNIKIPRQTAGASANWVGEGLSKPVSALAFDSFTVPWAKIAVICVITQELARFSSPSAELLVRNDLVKTIAEFVDKQFLDPTVTASAGLRPASITNGVTPIPSTGGTIAAIITDLSAAMTAMSNALQSVANPVWIMSATAAMYLSVVRTAQDIWAFPGMAGATTGAAQPAGGLNLMGVPVIVSNNVTVSAGKSSLVLVDQSQLMVADDGQVVIDTSTEAALQLDSAPATPPTPLVSLWQQNMLGIKAERFIYWVMRRPGAVQIITGFPGP